MDAAAAEADVKLYKASGELLAELQQKLPLLCKKIDGTSRQWVLYTKTAELARLLDSFQEWPQLLDPILADLVHVLVDSLLAYCLNSRPACYTQVAIQGTHIEPLPRAICRLLYVFCKVRGAKIIVRLLNNEPKYIEPLLLCFQTWSEVEGSSTGKMSWEERYIMLLWLSHLMLAPFALATISGTSLDVPSMEATSTLDLPEVSQSLLGIAFQHLFTASKDREAASILIVRVALREDMRRLTVPKAIISWCIGQLRADNTDGLIDQYRHVGLLTLLYGMTNSASSTEIAPFVDEIFVTCRWLATDPSPTAVASRHAAPSRKLLIKTMRSALLHSLGLSSKNDAQGVNNIDGMLEDGIQILLEWLADTDTPVRQAASKALGTIVLKLGDEMAAEVIEAVLGCLQENMLLEHCQTGRLIAATDLLNIDREQYRKNVNAVNPLKWHGAMLSLGHFLFRRSPPSRQLSDILEALLMGLSFEQRSNVGTSLGVGVRDAACFGLWSLARKYTTSEVEAAALPLSAVSSRTLTTQSTLQIIATELVIASCLDPSGNMRRGASAALQELVGRHPDMIKGGISVVQRVDYHAVARRSRAMLDVSEEVSDVDTVYHTCILYSLLEWRGCRAVDADSRRQAAEAVGKLFAKAETDAQVSFSTEIVARIQDLKSNNVGSNAAARHGLLLSVAAILQSRTPTSADGVDDGLHLMLQSLLDFDRTLGALTGRATADMGHVLEAVSTLLAAEAVVLRHHIIPEVRSQFLSAVMPILDRCTTATEDEIVALCAAEANYNAFMLLKDHQILDLLKSWLPKELPKHKSPHTSKGRLQSMSRAFELLASTPQLESLALQVLSFLASIISSHLPIEIKINAMSSISTILASSKLSEQGSTIITEAILTGLSDYTVDQRGDIGSLLRLASIDAVKSSTVRSCQGKTRLAFHKALARLSAEKLTKVRFAAFQCLLLLLKQDGRTEEPSKTFDYQNDVSSIEYYSEIMSLLKVKHVQKDVLKGLVTSIGGGADDISQVASSALVLHLNSQDNTIRMSSLHWMIEFLLEQLSGVVGQEDREVVPLLDVVCLLREQFFDETRHIFVARRQDVLNLLNDLQTPVADIPRIQALVRLLSELAEIDEYRSKVVDRITRKLLHKWPKVRHTAVDAVYGIDGGCVPLEVDWNKPAAANKPDIVRIRKVLGVAGGDAAAGVVASS